MNICYVLLGVMSRATTTDHILIGVMLISLKLTNYIDWPWWVVIMPFYLPFTLATVFISIQSYRNQKMMNDKERIQAAFDALEALEGLPIAHEMESALHHLWLALNSPQRSSIGAYHSRLLQPQDRQSHSDDLTDAHPDE